MKISWSFFIRKILRSTRTLDCDKYRLKSKGKFFSFCWAIFLYFSTPISWVMIRNVHVLWTLCVDGLKNQTGKSNHIKSNHTTQTNKQIKLYLWHSHLNSKSCFPDLCLVLHPLYVSLGSSLLLLANALSVLVHREVGPLWCIFLPHCNLWSRNKGCVWKCWNESR